MSQTRALAGLGLHGPAPQTLPHGPASDGPALDLPATRVAPSRPGLTGGSDHAAVSLPSAGRPRRTLAVLGLLALAIGFATPAVAAEPINLNARTARDLAELCGAAPRQPGADAKINFCHGFAQATVDMALKQAGGERPFCFPNPTPRRTETLNEFVTWVRATPDRQKLSSTDGLLQFMGQRFACSK